MSRKRNPPQLPTPLPAVSGQPSAVDPERAAAVARARRALDCEAEVKGVLARHRCAIQTVQVWTNGLPGPVQIQIVPLAEGAPTA